MQTQRNIHVIDFVLDFKFCYDSNENVGLDPSSIFAILLRAAGCCGTLNDNLAPNGEK